MTPRWAACLIVIFGLFSHALSAADALPTVINAVRVQIANGDLDAAIEAAEQAEESLPDDARTWFWSGRTYGLQAMQANLLTKMKWAGRSRDAYEKSVAMNPDFHEARFDLLQYYLFAPGIAGGGRDKANAQPLELASRDFVWGKLAASLLASVDKQPDAAEAALREAVVAVPDSQRARLALMRMLQRQKRWAESKVLWRERLTVAADTAIARYQIARIAVLSGEEAEDGLAMLDAFIAAGVLPEDITIGAAYWRRGLLLEMLGKHEQAIAALTLATRDPLVKKEASADIARISKTH